MLVSTIWAALRRRPFSVLYTLFLVIVYAALLRVPIALSVLLWGVGSLLVLGVWLLVEPFALDRLGCHIPTRGEQARLDSSIRRFNIAVRVADDPAPWVGSGLRTVVVSQGALDLLEDRGLVGLLGQATTEQLAAGLAREWVVWLGNAPLLAAWWMTRCLERIGQLLALAIGSALVLPMLVWPYGFVCWLGRALGVILVAVIGSVLLSRGAAAAGLGLLVGWALVLSLRALLAWEARRTEAEADLATVRASLGWHLHEALETLALAAPARPQGMLGLLVRPGVPLPRRAARVWQAITSS
jgi:hypothetical protein